MSRCSCGTFFRDLLAGEWVLCKMARHQLEILVIGVLASERGTDVSRDLFPRPNKGPDARYFVCDRFGPNRLPPLDAAALCPTGDADPTTVDLVVEGREIRRPRPDLVPRQRMGIERLTVSARERHLAFGVQCHRRVITFAFELGGFLAEGWVRDIPFHRER